MKQLTRDDLIEAAKLANSKTDCPLSRSDFVRLSGVSEYQIYHFFPEGGWSDLKQLSGIGKHPNDKQRIDDNNLLEEFHKVVMKLGQIPTWTLFNHHANVSADVVRRRFGGTKGTLNQYKVWLEEHHPDSPFLDHVRTRSSDQILSDKYLDLPDKPVHSVSWGKIEGSAEYGPPIDFRGLRHAPINEQGVVFLFGMVSNELGFIVEAVHASFPDCEAKRQIKSNNDRWQRVRIEFEFHSRTFKDHGHNPSGCDLIVCWENNWPESPLEVIELKTVIKTLKTGNA